MVHCVLLKEVEQRSEVHLLNAVVKCSLHMKVGSLSCFVKLCGRCNRCRDTA